MITILKYSRGWSTRGVVLTQLLEPLLNNNCSDYSRDWVTGHPSKRIDNRSNLRQTARRIADVECLDLGIWTKSIADSIPMEGEPLHLVVESVPRPPKIRVLLPREELGTQGHVQVILIEIRGNAEYLRPS